MIDDRTGQDHAAAAVLYTLSAGLPAKLAVVNAALHCTARSPLAGPYVIPSGGKTLILALDSAAAGTYPIAAGTYTAAQLAAALAAATGFTAAGLSANTFFDGYHLRAYKTAAGNGSITVGAGTINAIIGLNVGEIFRTMAIPTPTWYRVADPDDPPPAAVSVAAWPESAIINDAECVHSVKVRIRTESIVYSAGASNVAAAQAFALSWACKEILEDSPSLHSESDGHVVQSLTPGVEAGAESQINAFVDIDTIVNVEEE